MARAFKQWKRTGKDGLWDNLEEHMSTLKTDILAKTNMNREEWRRVLSTATGLSGWESCLSQQLLKEDKEDVNLILLI